MPELPEVETVARDLGPWQGAKLSRLSILDERVWFESEFPPAMLRGRRLEELFRRGKYIVWNFGGHYLLQHLRMTGKVLPSDSRALPAKQKDNPQIRARFDFEKKQTLFFFDTRRFGTLTGVRSLEKFWSTKKLAPDPLLPSDAEIARDFFLARARASARPIKALLLDQTKISGVGNIYADEALFAQGIHPLTPAEKLRSEELLSLFENILRIFRAAIESRGTSAFNYLGVNGKPGEFQSFLRVYQRDGETCTACKTSLIQAITIVGRSSHFCPLCQPRRKPASDLRNIKTGVLKNARSLAK